MGWHSLVPSDDAITISPQGENFVEVDGPYAESKEQLGGVYILECADMSEAIEFAKRMPCATHGKVEVRQMLSD